ncbi:MAG: hypothetical protein RIM23_11900 [Coleofasciculus sp. G3-WIS-01]|uniref:hypothetical protein n=1 Tax=Coleofasciculus sp. G3-WIS-01 TaxID=3069528 RepID=UPI0032F9F3BB
MNVILFILGLLLVLLSLLDTLWTALWVDGGAGLLTDHVPPAPDLASVRQAGIPVVSDEEFMRSRQLWLEFVRFS